MTQQKKETPMQETLSLAYYQYAKNLDKYARFKINDRALSGDLVQDTFTKTWNYMVKGGKISLMKSFLYKIMKNLIVDEYRKRKTTSLDIIMDKKGEPHDSSHESLPDQLDGREMIMMIKFLPEKYRTVMHMRYVQELTLKEMTLLNGQSRNTNAVQLCRGLVKLKVLYNKRQ